MEDTYIHTYASKRLSHIPISQRRLFQHSIAYHPCPSVCLSVCKKSKKASKAIKGLKDGQCTDTDQGTCLFGLQLQLQHAAGFKLLLSNIGTWGPN